MGRRRIRTKSNRLTTGEQRRRLKRANLQPGEVIILDVSRRARKGVRSKGAIQISVVGKTQAAADFDVRKLVHMIRIRLAEHYKRKLLAGERPSGRAPLPELREKTVTRNPGRPDSFGLLSKEMSRRWMLLKVRGGPFKASTRIKPWGGDGRRFAINRWLGRGIDLQGVDGESAQIIADTTAEWLELSVPTSGDGVATPRRANTRAGELPQF